MAKDEGAGGRANQFNLRLPDGMRDRLKDEAFENGRSLNAEIVFRLEAYDLHAEDRNVLLGKIARLERSKAVLEAELSLRTGDVEGKASRLDSEHRETGRRIQKLEKSLGRLLHEVTALRDRTEVIQAHPERFTPEQLVRRAAMQDVSNPDGPVYLNPYEEHSSLWRDYRLAFRNALIRRFKAEEIQAMHEFDHLFVRSDGTPYEAPVLIGSLDSPAASTRSTVLSSGRVIEEIHDEKTVEERPAISRTARWQEIANRQKAKSTKPPSSD